MQWDIVGNSLGVRRRDREARWNTMGDRRKKTVRLTVRMLEAARLTGGLVFTQRRSIVNAGIPQGGGLGEWT
ncbi:hypothetical protein BHE74_00022684 [Ensete ventricosum]|nr:hypothetical protein BHE74_00022684 [Ensete ventricosum]